MTSSGQKNKPTEPAEAVSVVIPVYNGAETIARALDSVLAQSFQDFRILVVDDCSTDDTVAVVSRYDDPRIEIIHLDQNQGASAARNTAIVRARGRYIAFLDADDMWRPEKLERQVAFMDEASPHIGACFCDFILHRDASFLRSPRPRLEWVDSLVDGCWVSPGSTMLVRREVYPVVGDYDATFERLEDWDWLLRCVDHFDLRALPEALVEIFVAGGPNFEAVERSTERMLERHRERILVRRGRAGLRRFQSSLALENVVAHVRGGKVFGAIWLMAYAFALSPLRVAAFMTRNIAIYFSRGEKGINAPLMNFVRGGLGILTVNVAGAGLAFVSHILLVRIMGLEAYGHYVFALAWVSVLSFVALAGQNTTVVRFASAYLRREKWGELAGVVRMGSIVVLFLGVLTASLGGVALFFLGGDFGAELKTTLALATALIPLTGLLLYRVAVLQALGRLARGYMFSEIARPLLLMAAVLVLAAAGAAGAVQTMTANIVVTVLVLVGLVALAGRYAPVEMKQAPKQFQPRQWIGVGAPLFLVGAVQILLTQTDVLMIGWLMGTENSGLYAPAMRLSTLIAFPIIAIRGLIAPQISAAYADNDGAALQRHFSISMWMGGVSGVAIGICVYVLREPLLGLFGPEFRPLGVELGVLIAGQVTVALLGPVEMFLLMTRHEKLMAAFLVAMTALNLTLNYILIPRYGLLGAASATAVTIVLNNMAVFVAVCRLHGLRPYGLGGGISKMTGQSR